MARNKKGQHPARRTGAPPVPRERSQQIEAFPGAIQYSKTTYSGPLPPAEQLHQYNEIVPGAGDRIIGMAEREAEHRHLMERAMLRIHSRNSTLGVISGLLIGLAAIGAGGYGLANGADLAGAGVALGGLASLVGVFVWQRRAPNSKKEGA